MRALARAVAHNNMKEAGLVRVNKKRAGDSFFSRHWREYIKGGKRAWKKRK